MARFINILLMFRDLNVHCIRILISHLEKVYMNLDALTMH